MDPITGIVASQAVQGVTEVVQEALTPAKTESGGDFESVLGRLLPESAGNSIDEEALFAALLEERIHQQHGEEAASQFHEMLNQHKSKMTRHDGYVAVEDAANAALTEFQESGALTAEEAGDIRSQAFKAAQLDDDHTQLFDGRGSANDNTVATAPRDAALASALAMLGQIENGDASTEISTEGAATGTEGETATPGGAATTETGEKGEVTYTPEGNSVDGADKFVSKPASERDGSWVVLLPPDLAGDIETVTAKDSNGNQLEQAESSGVSNGGRPTYRFSNPGSEYGQNVTLEIQLTSGDIINYAIPDPGQRYD